MSASRAPSRRRSSRPAKADEQRALVRAILRLPPDPRDVFLLHRMAGMSYEQIGHQLGMEREAVLVHLADALVQISRAARPVEV